MPQLNVQLDDKSYQELKIAAAIEKFDSLRAWATHHLIARAQQITTEYKTQATHAGMPNPPQGDGT